jgi:DNA-directed RNA polymerase subunit E'/Rpb7
MGHQSAARLARASTSVLPTQVAVVVGIVLPVAAFGWFVIVAPAAISFAVAEVAAMTWCAWLEKHPQLLGDGDRSTQETSASDSRTRSLSC